MLDTLQVYWREKNSFPLPHTYYFQPSGSYTAMPFSVFFTEFQGGQDRLELLPSSKEYFLAGTQRDGQALVLEGKHVVVAP